MTQVVPFLVGFLGLFLLNSISLFLPMWLYPLLFILLGFLIKVIFHKTTWKTIVVTILFYIISNALFTAVLLNYYGAITRSIFLNFLAPVQMLLFYLDVNKAILFEQVLYLVVTFYSPWLSIVGLLLGKKIIDKTP